MRHEDVQRRVAGLEIGGIQLVEVEMAAETRVPAARFPGASFQIVLAGGYYEPPADASRKPGSVHFHPPDDLQAAVVPVKSRIFGVCLFGDRLDDQFGALPSEPTDIDDPNVADCLRRLRRELHQPDDLSALSAQAICTEMMVGFRRSIKSDSVRTPNWLRKARDLVTDQPAASHSLGAIAIECGVHPSHLARRFRQEYGMSIGEYVRHCRVQSAQRLLTQTDLALEDIAIRTGFCDASHLCRVMRAQTGRSPRGSQSSQRSRRASNDDA